MTVLLWTFPLLMFASIVIGWAAEVTAVHLSAGIALALLAWLQTAPEFAVEATIAWNRDVHLALANLTGSLRLLLGFGWPMIFFIHWAVGRRRFKKHAATHTAHSRVYTVALPHTFAVEAAGLFAPVIYFTVIYLKGTWHALDGAILCLLYVFYFWMLNRQRKHAGRHEEERDEQGHHHIEAQSDEPAIVRWLLARGQTTQTLATLGMFAFGGLALWFTVHPFIEGLKTVALALGVSEFVFIQWVAPVASEFPEKVTAFNWARKPGKAPMALVNMLSSVTSQWTLLAGLVPILFALSAKDFGYTITFDDFQRHELLLTIAQSALAVALLADLRLTALEMLGFFALWLVQFVAPSARIYLVPVYLFWTLAEATRYFLDPTKLVVPGLIRRLFSSRGARRASS